MLNGFLFASLVSRIPDLRAGLSLDNGGLGLLLLSIAVGSVLALPSAGHADPPVERGAVVRSGRICGALGLAGGGRRVPARLGLVPVCAVGLFAFGIGTGVWDVAMNVEGAEVERGLGRSIMPRFHAAWSIGAIAGAAIGVPMAALACRCRCTSVCSAALAVVLCLRGTRVFLPAEEEQPRRAGPSSAWLEPRTLAIGVMVLAFTVAEGAAERLAVAGAHRRVPRPALGRGHRLRRVRVRDDSGPGRRAGRAGPVRPGAGAVGLVGRSRRPGRCW